MIYPRTAAWVSTLVYLYLMQIELTVIKSLVDDFCTLGHVMFVLEKVVYSPVVNTGQYRLENRAELFTIRRKPKLQDLYIELYHPVSKLCP